MNIINQQPNQLLIYYIWVFGLITLYLINSTVPPSC